MIIYFPKLGHYNLPWLKKFIEHHDDATLITHNLEWVDDETNEKMRFIDDDTEERIEQHSKLELFIRLFKSSGIFLIHGYGSLYELTLIVLAKKLGYKVVVRGEFTRRRPNKYYFDLNNKLKRLVSRSVDLFLPISAEGETYVRKNLLYRGEIVRLPYIVNDNLISKIERSQVIYDFIFVGKLINRKGIKTFLRALDERNYGKVWRVCIVGSGPLVNEIKNFKSPFIDVVFLGFKPPSECYKLIASSKVLVLPSEFETWGLVVNEAMMLGTKVVCSSEVGAGIDFRHLIGIFVFEVHDHLSLYVNLAKALEADCIVEFPSSDIGRHTIDNHNNRLSVALKNLASY